MQEEIMAAHFWGEQEAWEGQPRVAPPEWNEVEQLAWYEGYDDVTEPAMAA